MPTKKRARQPGPVVTPEDILRIHTPEVRAIVERLRALVKETVPEAEERAYPGWRALGYRRPVVGYFCGFFPYDDVVKLYFEHGAALPDPDGLLEGDGKQVRWVGGEGGRGNSWRSHTVAAKGGGREAES